MKTAAFRSIKLSATSRWLRAALLLTWPLLLAESASAQDFWVADGVGNWNVPANWSAGVPTAGTDAQINNGGTARLFDPGARAIIVTLGSSSGNSGTLEVLGGASTFNTFIVGSAGHGTLNIANGGRVVSGLGGGSLGYGVGSNGTATVGAGSNWGIGGELDVGFAGTGTLNITGGGYVDNAQAFIGRLLGSTGEVTVAGADSLWQCFNGDLAVGSAGAGTLNITDGGVVTSTNGRVGQEAGSTGAVLIDGFGSRWTASGAFTVGLFNTGASTLTVQNGGVLSAAGGMTIGTLGTLRGDGTIVGNVTNIGGGTVAPGTSPGTLHITGNYRQSFGATLQIELASPTSFDKLAVTGNITLPGGFEGGGALHVSLTGGYVPHSSQSFDILDWGGSLNGAFDAIVLPTLGGTLTWNTSQLYTTGVLSVVGPPAPAFTADFDEDGDVDGVDLNQWQGDFGANALSDADNDGDSDGADFLQWQRQLGSPAALASATTVPEPTGIVIMAALLFLPLKLDRRGRHRSVVGAFSSVLLLYSAFTAGAAQAQTFWVAGGIGNWSNPDNWSAGLPSPSKAAFINNGGTAQSFNRSQVAGYVGVGENVGDQGRLEVLGGQLQVVFMRVALDGAGELLIQGGQLSGLFGVLGGRDPNSFGAATVSGATSNWTITQEGLRVGLFGTGWLSIKEGGTVSNMNNALDPTIIGQGLSADSSVGNGTVIVDGANSKFTNNADLYVGQYGTGRLHVQNGGWVSNFNGNLGVFSGSSGAASVDGPGSVWTNNSVLAVGVSGAAALSITGGGAVSSTNGRIGREGGSTGMVTVDGLNSTWTNSGELDVGSRGTGTLNVQNEGIVSNTSGYIGRSANSTGAVTVNGAFSLWASSSDLTVGNLGTGQLNISDGATILNHNGNIGAGVGSIGAATVDGAASVWVNNSVLAVGVLGRGTLNITGGGVVWSTNGRVGREAGSTGTALIDGPGSRWNASGVFTMGLFGTGTASVTVQNGGVLSAAGGMTIGTLGTLLGDGRIVGNVTSVAGIVAPGTSPGTLHITGNYTQSFGGTLQIELASPASFDKLAVTGNITLPFGSIAGGGTLQVSLAGGYVPQGSQSFDVLDCGSLSGAFDSVVLPTLGGTLVWDTSQLYTTGVLSVVGPPAASDFDGNGVVDGADLAIWREGFGGDPANEQGDADGDGDIDGGDFLTWQRQLGSVQIVPAAGQVPEPGAFALLSIACGGLALLRRRNR